MYNDKKYGLGNLNEIIKYQTAEDGYIFPHSMQALVFIILSQSHSLAFTLRPALEERKLATMIYLNSKQHVFRDTLHLMNSFTLL